MSLLDLYSKQFVPAFNKDQGKKGGRGRRRGRKMRGGLTMAEELNAAAAAPGVLATSPAGSPAAYGVPNFNEFARVYTGQIRAAMGAAESKLYTDVKEGKAAIDAKIADKPNQAAKKAAMELASKVLVLVNDSDKKLSTRKTSEMPESAIEQKRQLFPYVQRNSAVYGLLLKFIPQETWNKIPERGIFGMKKKGGAEDDETDSVQIDSDEEGADGQEGGLSLFKKKEIPPVPEGELKDVPYAWDTVATPQQWEAVKEPVELAMEEYKKAVDAYVAAFDILEKQVPNPFKEAPPAEDVMGPDDTAREAEKAVKTAETSDSIHQELLKAPDTKATLLDKRTKAFQKVWDSAKAARDSLCTGVGKLADYKGGPETYEKLTNQMRAGEKLTKDAAALKTELAAFAKKYKQATKGIKFVANSSFILSQFEKEREIEQSAKEVIDWRRQQDPEYNRVLTAAEAAGVSYDAFNQAEQGLERSDPSTVAVFKDLYAETPEGEAARKLKSAAQLEKLKDNLKKKQAQPAASAGDQKGGALTELVALRKEFDLLSTRYEKLTGDMDLKEISLETTTKKLEAIDSKGPMTPQQRKVEDDERTTREAFRTAAGMPPLPMECVPYTYVPPPPSTLPPALPPPPPVDDTSFQSSVNPMFAPKKSTE
jgi:hypothetical protein